MSATDLVFAPNLRECPHCPDDGCDLGCMFIAKTDRLTWHILAEQVALNLDGPDNECPAWMESADRRCGKAPTVGFLCARHHKVALSRWEKAKAKDAAVLAKSVEKAKVRLPDAEAELARVEARLQQLDPMLRERRNDPSTDPAMVNMPLRRRMVSDTRIEILARLHEKRERLASEVSRLRTLVGAA